MRKAESEREKLERNKRGDGDFNIEDEVESRVFERARKQLDNPGHEGVKSPLLWARCIATWNETSSSRDMGEWTVKMGY